MTLADLVTIPRWTYRLGHAGIAGGLSLACALLLALTPGWGLLLGCGGYVLAKEGWDVLAHYRAGDDVTVTWRDFAADTTDVALWVPVVLVRSEPIVAGLSGLLWVAAFWLTRDWSRP